METIIKKETIKDMKDSFKVISSLIKEVILEFQENKLKIVALNSNNVCMIIFEFKIVNSNIVNVGIDTKEFYNILKVLNDKEDILLNIIEDKIQLTQEGSIFNITILDLDENEIKDLIQRVPELNYNNKFNIQFKEIQSIFKQIRKLSDIIKISYIQDMEELNFSFENSTSNFNKYIEVIPENKEESIKCNYPTEYLYKILQFKIFKEVTLFLNNDYPLSLEFEKKGLKIKYILAPRGE